MRLFNYDTKQVVYEDDQVKANELIDAGEAIKLDLPELEQYEKKAVDVYNSYKNAVERIKQSENPLLQDEKVQKYELDRLEKEYRKQSAEVEEQYQSYRKSSIEDAKIRAAQATVNLTEKDKEVAEQFATRASLTLAGAYGQDKGVTVQQISDEIGLLTDEQRTALQANASQLLANIDEPSDKRKLITAMQEVRNPDLLALEVAKQLPYSVLTMQNISDIAKRVVSEQMHTAGGIDKEFYEKHLKGSDK